MRCMICQRFLPKTARKGTKFCGTNCRSRAYRLREQPAEATKHGQATGTDGSQGPLHATGTRKRANSRVTIPAVLERLQQIRERAGLSSLRIDPMLAYQANLDALLTEHMATRRILAPHVTNAGQVARGNTAWLNEPNTTQVGIGVSLTERGDSVVVILLGKQVTEAPAIAFSSDHPPASTTPPAPHEAIRQVVPPLHEISTLGEKSRPILTHLTKLKLRHAPIPKDQPTPTMTSDDFEVAETDAIVPSNEDEPET